MYRSKVGVHVPVPVGSYRYLRHCHHNQLIDSFDSRVSSSAVPSVIGAQCNGVRACSGCDFYLLAVAEYAWVAAAVALDIQQPPCSGFDVRLRLRGRELLR